jgi:hypothetical protein
MLTCFYCCIVANITLLHCIVLLLTCFHCYSDDDNSRPGSGLLSEHGLGQAVAVTGLNLPSTSADMGVPDLGHLDLPPDNDTPPDQTTLLHNEEESFALAPVDAATLKGKQ